MKKQNQFVQTRNCCLTNGKIALFLFIFILLFNSCKQTETENTATNEGVMITEESIKNPTKSIENSTNTTTENTIEPDVYLKILEQNYTATNKEFKVGKLKFNQDGEYNRKTRSLVPTIELEQNFHIINTNNSFSFEKLIVINVGCTFQDENCMDISYLLDNYPITLLPSYGSLEIGFFNSSLDGMYKLVDDLENEIILESTEINNSKIVNFKGHYKLKFIKKGVNSNPEIITLEGKCIYK